MRSKALKSARALTSRPKGSEHRDEITADGFLSNHAGGGSVVSSGQDIVANLALKPTSSIRLPEGLHDLEETEVVTTGRHDPCVGIRRPPSPRRCWR